MSYMTKIDNVPDSESVKPGMAFFAGTGPAGGVCGTCKFRGMSRTSLKGIWDEAAQATIYKSYRYPGCQIFKQMTGRYGPCVSRHWLACKYYQQKKK